MKIYNIENKLIYYSPGILSLIPFILYGFSDYWVIGVVGNPDEIARYNFGAEAMIAHGGEKYRSANAYATSSLVIGMLSSLGLAASTYVLFKSSQKAILKAYCGSALTIIIVVVAGHV